MVAIAGAPCRRVGLLQRRERKQDTGHAVDTDGAHGPRHHFPRRRESMIYSAAGSTYVSKLSTCIRGLSGAG